MELLLDFMNNKKRIKIWGIKNIHNEYIYVYYNNYKWIK